MGSASSISLEGMAPHDVARLELAYAQAKDDGLDGWDLVQVSLCVLFGLSKNVTCIY